MLTQVEVFSPRVPTSLLPYAAGSPATDPIQIRKIDGLGPVPATLVTQKYGLIDGEWLSGSTVGKRNIVLTVGLRPNWASQTIESLREILYTYMMPRSPIRLRFSSTHMPTVDISGTVETFEPNIFAKDPEYTISILCPQPDFIDIAASQYSGTTQAIGGTTNLEIDYEGTANTGFVLTVEKGSGADINGQIQVVNEAPYLEVLSVNPGLVNASNYVEFSTVAGDKYVRRISGSTRTNIIGSTPQNTIWTQLKPGRNKFRVLTPSAGLSWTLRYFKRFGGL